MKRRNREVQLVERISSNVTVVTVVTLIFTPMLKGHHWKNVLTGKTTETHTVQCASHHPCPKYKRIVRKIILPKP